MNLVLFFADIRIECKVFIFLFGLICGLSFISGLYGDWQIHKGVKSVQNSSQDAVNWLNEVKNYSRRANQALDVDITIISLKNHIQTLSGIPGAPSFDSYLSNCDSILEYLRTSKNQIREANKTLNDSEFDSIPKYVEDYGNMFCIVALTVLLVLAIIALVFTFAICSRCVLGCFTVLALISFILCSLLMGTTFGASVGGSDFCLDDKKWIRSEINDPLVSSYLIDCLDNNVVKKYMTEAMIYVLKAKETNEQLKQLKGAVDSLCQITQKCPSNLQQGVKLDLDNLDTNIKQITELIQEFQGLADCRRINTDLNDILNTICTDGLKGIVMIFFNTIASSVCFAILIFSATFALR